MNQNLTDLTLIIDRSGSMALIQQKAEAGIRGFCKEQMEAAGEISFTLVEFNHQVEFKHGNLQSAAYYNMQPHGRTALYDALGRVIDLTGVRLSKLSEEHRPGLVIVAVVTDGIENASREYDLDKVREMIKTQTDAYSWQFIFLGGYEGAEFTGDDLEIQTAAGFDPQKIDYALAGASSNVTRMRTNSAAGRQVSNEFTAAEISAMDGKTTK